ncbi:hypothetical protein MQX02_18820 [Acinetobacter baumannii]|nr:hypothetical protein [Acinetobacter baumannii]MCI3942971.1 hypothetical protein [Acinetobacter baumannii]
MKPNGRPTWLGKRFIKMKINCNTQQAALVADAVINSDGTVVKDIIYREKDNVKWGEISMFYKALLHKPICKGFFSDIIFK